ncbi:MAG: GldG family protein [Treponema sp.]|jgi:hypothetical protein|nr:GldG family protein [Treponema sp.]
MALKFFSKLNKPEPGGNGSGTSGRKFSPGSLFGKRNLRYGFVSVCITVVVIAVIVLFNVVLTSLFKKYPLDIDLTADQIFEISDETKNYLAGLDTDVNIYVLNTESGFVAVSPAEYFVQANEVIRRYAQYSSRVRLEYIDTIRNPNFVSQYPDLDLVMNDILIVSGNKSRKVSPQDLFNIRSSYYGSYVSSSKAEQAMTSALLGVTSAKTSLAALIGGHGEDDISSLTELLRMNSWEQISLNTLTEDIPPDVNLLILPAPQRDLAPEELSKIDAFLESGDKRVFLYLGSNTQPGQTAGQAGLTNLDAFLAEWGIAVDPGIVFETNNSRIVGNSPFMAFADFVEGDYSKSVMEKELYPVLPQSRPLRVLFEAQRYRRTSVLIQASAGSGIVPPDAPQDWSPGPQDMKPGVPLMTLTTSVRNNAEGDLISSHLVVCGSVLALNQYFLGNANFGNSAFFLDLLGNLSGREDQIYVQDKTLGFSSMTVTGGQLIVLGIIFIVLIPLAVLVSGIVVWLRRRHR